QSTSLRMGVFGLSLTGTLYSVYLTYLEIAVLRAICPFCVVSAISIFVLLIVGVIRLKENFIDID
ncbi:MAG: vitamin K epoxide reductase family protein, partial [Anaerolineales bacterium]